MNKHKYAVVSLTNNTVWSIGDCRTKFATCAAP